MTELESRFREAMLRIYDVAKEKCGYRPIRFREKIPRDGALAAAQGWLSKETPQKGLITLCEHGLLKISMEALVLEPEFAPLFTEEGRAVARKRLRALGYEAP